MDNKEVYFQYLIKDQLNYKYNYRDNLYNINANNETVLLFLSIVCFKNNLSRDLLILED